MPIFCLFSTVFFQRLAVKTKNELTSAIENAKKSLSESERNTDSNDVASSQEMQQLYVRTVDRQGKLLRKVNSALRCIDNGEYGYCEVSGEPIGLKRLLARPTATLSIELKPKRFKNIKKEPKGKKG